MIGLSRKQKKTLWRILAAGALCIVVALLPLEGGWRALAFAVPYLIVGWDVLRGAALNILHGQVFDEKFLMAVATLERVTRDAQVLGEKKVKISRDEVKAIVRGSSLRVWSDALLKRQYGKLRERTVRNLEAAR